MKVFYSVAESQKVIIRLLGSEQMRTLERAQKCAARADAYALGLGERNRLRIFKVTIEEIPRKKAE